MLHLAAGVCDFQSRIIPTCQQDSNVDGGDGDVVQGVCCVKYCNLVHADIGPKLLTEQPSEETLDIHNKIAYNEVKENLHRVDEEAKELPIVETEVRVNVPDVQEASEYYPRPTTIEGTENVHSDAENKEAVTKIKEKNTCTTSEIKETLHKPSVFVEVRENLHTVTDVDKSHHNEDGSFASGGKPYCTLVNSLVSMASPLSDHFTESSFGEQVHERGSSKELSIGGERRSDIPTEIHLIPVEGEIRSGGLTGGPMGVEAFEGSPVLPVSGKAALDTATGVPTSSVKGEKDLQTPLKSPVSLSDVRTPGSPRGNIQLPSVFQVNNRCDSIMTDSGISDLAATESDQSDNGDQYVEKNVNRSEAMSANIGCGGDGMREAVQSGDQVTEADESGVDVKDNINSGDDVRENMETCNVGEEIGHSGSDASYEDESQSFTDSLEQRESNPADSLEQDDEEDVQGGDVLCMEEDTGLLDDPQQMEAANCAGWDGDLSWYDFQSNDFFIDFTLSNDDDVPFFEFDPFNQPDFATLGKNGLGRRKTADTYDPNTNDGYETCSSNNNSVNSQNVLEGSKIDEIGDIDDVDNFTLPGDPGGSSDGGDGGDGGGQKGNESSSPWTEELLGMQVTPRAGHQESRAGAPHKDIDYDFVMQDDTWGYSSHEPFFDYITGERILSTIYEFEVSSEEDNESLMTTEINNSDRLSTDRMSLEEGDHNLQENNNTSEEKEQAKDDLAFLCDAERESGSVSGGGGSGSGGDGEGTVGEGTAVGDSDGGGGGGGITSGGGDIGGVSTSLTDRVGVGGDGDRRPSFPPYKFKSNSRLTALDMYRDGFLANSLKRKYKRPLRMTSMDADTKLAISNRIKAAEEEDLEKPDISTQSDTDYNDDSVAPDKNSPNKSSGQFLGDNALLVACGSSVSTNSVTASDCIGKTTDTICDVILNNSKQHVLVCGSDGVNPQSSTMEDNEQTDNTESGTSLNVDGRIHTDTIDKFNNNSEPQSYLLTDETKHDATKVVSLLQGSIIFDETHFSHGPCVGTPRVTEVTFACNEKDQTVRNGDTVVDSTPDLLLVDGCVETSAGSLEQTETPQDIGNYLQTTYETVNHLKSSTTNTTTSVSTINTSSIIDPSTSTETFTASKVEIKKTNKNHEAEQRTSENEDRFQNYNARQTQVLEDDDEIQHRNREACPMALDNTTQKYTDEATSKAQKSRQISEVNITKSSSDLTKGISSELTKGISASTGDMESLRATYIKDDVIINDTNTSGTDECAQSKVVNADNIEGKVGFVDVITESLLTENDIDNRVNIAHNEDTIAMIANSKDQLHNAINHQTVATTIKNSYATDATNVEDNTNVPGSTKEMTIDKCDKQLGYIDSQQRQQHLPVTSCGNSQTEEMMVVVFGAGLDADLRDNRCSTPVMQNSVTGEGSDCGVADRHSVGGERIHREDSSFDMEVDPFSLKTIECYSISDPPPSKPARRHIRNQAKHQEVTPMEDLVVTMINENDGDGNNLINSVDGPTRPERRKHVSWREDISIYIPRKSIEDPVEVTVQEICRAETEVAELTLSESDGGGRNEEFCVPLTFGRYDLKVDELDAHKDEEPLSPTSVPLANSLEESLLESRTNYDDDKNSKAHECDLEDSVETKNVSELYENFHTQNTETTVGNLLLQDDNSLVLPPRRKKRSSPVINILLENEEPVPKEDVSGVSQQGEVPVAPVRKKKQFFSLPRKPKDVTPKPAARRQVKRTNSTATCRPSQWDAQENLIRSDELSGSKDETSTKQLDDKESNKEECNQNLNETESTNENFTWHKDETESKEDECSWNMDEKMLKVEKRPHYPEENESYSPLHFGNNESVLDTTGVRLTKIMHGDKQSRRTLSEGEDEEERKTGAGRRGKTLTFMRSGSLRERMYYTLQHNFIKGPSSPKSEKGNKLKFSKLFNRKQRIYDFQQSEVIFGEKPEFTESTKYSESRTREPSKSIFKSCLGSNEGEQSTVKNPNAEAGDDSAEGKETPCVPLRRRKKSKHKNNGTEDQQATQNASCTSEKNPDVSRDENSDSIDNTHDDLTDYGGEIGSRKFLKSLENDEECDTVMTSGPGASSPSDATTSLPSPSLSTTPATDNQHRCNNLPEATEITTNERKENQTEDIELLIERFIAGVTRFSRDTSYRPDKSESKSHTHENKPDEYYNISDESECKSDKSECKSDKGECKSDDYECKSSDESADEGSDPSSCGLVEWERPQVPLQTWAERQGLPHLHLPALNLRLDPQVESGARDHEPGLDGCGRDTPSPGPPVDSEKERHNNKHKREEDRTQKDRCVEVYPETVRQRQRNMMAAANKVDIKNWGTSGGTTTSNNNNDTLTSPAKVKKFLPSVKALRSQFEAGKTNNNKPETNGNIITSNGSNSINSSNGINGSSGAPTITTTSNNSVSNSNGNNLGQSRKTSSSVSSLASSTLEKTSSTNSLSSPSASVENLLSNAPADNTRPVDPDEPVEPIYNQFKMVDQELRDLMSKPPSTSGWNPRPLLKRLYYIPEAPRMQTQGTTYINIEGYLEKLPSGRKKATFWNAWKRRYFVAKDGILYYYQGNQTEKPSMKMTLMGGRVESMEPNMVGVDDGKGHYVVVRCSSRQEAERWRRALETHTVEDFASQYVQPWPIPTNPTLLRDTLVIDIGSSSIRAGVLASQATLPQLFMPSVVANSREGRRQVWGFDALAPDVRSTSTVTFPIRPSHKISKYSVDLSSVSSLLQKTFADLKVDPKNYNLQLSVPRVLNTNTQAELLRLLFDKHGVRSVNLTHQSILALYAYNATSGIVVDVGERMDIVPVIDGYIVDGGVSRVPYGGYRIMDHLRQFLYMRNVSLINEVESYIIRHVLENICYCAHHYNTEKARCTTNSENYEKSVSLAEYFSKDCPFESISLDFGRFQATEGLFNPDAWGLDHPGIHKLVHKAIMECSMDIRKEMSRSIFLAGGVTQMPGLVDRLTTELDNLTPPAIRPKVHASPYRYHAAYIGACVLAESPAFAQSRITREDWNKYGNAALRKWSL
ncbi:hypothetical protein Pmani_009416 [Petrolisthes manimaculis]|uniref:PH domain-containing protein n=1 Tax=Petrolisthes manimaculis TaxID=1843537 RepID=A0AAE1UDN7_9EUCA|nr:hypothetical protein Pmani_009416 [Petrolisthes manimaculis]